MLRLVDHEDVPKRERKGESRFESLPDWPRLKSSIDEGIPPGMDWTLQLTPEILDKIGLSSETTSDRRTATGTLAIRRFILQYVRSVGKRYNVKMRHSGGYDLVIVEGPPKSAKPGKLKRKAK